MDVWLVEEHHRAEGSQVLAVLGEEPTQEEAEQIMIDCSSYDKAERAHWCQVSVAHWVIGERLARS